MEVTLLDVSEFFLDPGLERWGEGGHVRTGDIELKTIRTKNHKYVIFPNSDLMKERLILISSVSTFKFEF